MLQLSKSAKDVPDTAVFAGDLNQIQTIAEQEQPETEPKADAIRGAAALVRRFSTAREKMEMEELKRLREEKEAARLETLSEDGAPQYEWDGLRRRRTTMGSHRTGSTATAPPGTPFSKPATTESPHPPLGMSRFPTEDELAQHDRPFSAGLSNVIGTISRRATSVLPGHPDFRPGSVDTAASVQDISSNKVQSPMHPVQLTEIAVQAQHTGGSGSRHGNPYGVPSGQTEYDPSASSKRIHFGGETRHTPSSLAPPTPPPHGMPGHASARRQFSFQNPFKRHRDQHDPADERPTSSRSNRPISNRGYSAPHAKTATGTF